MIAARPIDNGARAPSATAILGNAARTQASPEPPAPADAARTNSSPMWGGPMLGEPAAREYRLRAVFDCGKLDPQVGDTPVLAPFPLMIDRGAWLEVAGLAQALSAEAIAAEREIVARPKLHRALGLEPVLCRVLARCGPADVDSGPRLSRFDFHWVRDPDPARRSNPGLHADGPPAGRWQISEVNADVPGGLIEAGPLARLMSQMATDHSQRRRASPEIDISGHHAGPDPAGMLARCLADRLRPASPPSTPAASTAPVGLVALVHATAYADDFQVMRRLAACLEAAGVSSVMCAPDHVAWNTSTRLATHAPTGRPLAAVLRFFPAEWLPGVGRASRWTGFFRAGGPLLCNPGTALLVQSKRWPLLWDRLATPLPTWRRLLPETVDPREIGRCATSAGVRDHAWVLKPAMGRVGEGVLIPGVESRQARAIQRAARRHPRHWVAQRRFESIAVSTPIGPLHVCLGVYVVDGRAAGMYARASARPLIDQGAFELPVLISDQHPVATHDAPNDRATSALSQIPRGQEAA